MSVRCLLLCLCLTGVARSDQPLTVGAIRWDAWFADNDYESHLAPPQWKARWPFYARESADGKLTVRSDSQEVMDREIDFAADGKLDYWAFCYYHPKSWNGADRYNYGWKLYLSSKKKQRLHFCLLLQGQHLGPLSDWHQTATNLVQLMREPTYQKVLEDRPLLYIFSVDELRPWAGSSEAAKARLDELRAQCKSAGLKVPYLVAQVFRVEDGVDAMNTMGFDAISAYSLPGGSGDRELPFADLAIANRAFWNACAASGKEVIPLVNTGWDNRPRRGLPGGETLSGPWFTPPTSDELSDHLRSAFQWNRENAARSPANTVLIYAWNESDEGGWLVPTAAEGTARLEALRKARNRFQQN